MTTRTVFPLTLFFLVASHGVLRAEDWNQNYVEQPASVDIDEYFENFDGPNYWGWYGKHVNPESRTFIWERSDRKPFPPSGGFPGSSPDCLSTRCGPVEP